MKKSKKFLSVFLAFLMIISIIPMSNITASAEENETQEHLTEIPEGYIGIYTKDDLDNIKLDMSGKYILMNDIVFEDSDYEKGGSFYNSGKGWVPIGTYSTKFTGVFDGNGYIISNLCINSPGSTYVGLFGYADKATIRNVTIIDSDLVGNDCVGGIIGYITGGGLIENCKFNGSITGEQYVGGITGHSYNGPTISHCSTLGTVSGAEFVGGIVGKQSATPLTNTNQRSNIIYCNNAALINADSFAGGIVGESYSSLNEWYVSSQGRWLYSYGYTYVEYCSNSGSVTTIDSTAGGIAGSSSGYTSYIQYCYNSGDVSASSYAGGIGGEYSGSTYATHCYSIGNVTAISDFGGCFGERLYNATFCYYLDESVVNPTCTTGISKSEDQLKKATTFEQWDFNTVWTMDGRKDYPYPELIGVSLVLPEDLVHKHEYVSNIIKEATHTELGVKKFICECGDTYTEEIEKTSEHTYKTTITYPTCLDRGYTTYTCACGDSYIQDYVTAIGHVYMEFFTPPTCMEQGYTTYICTCGYNYIGNYIDSTGHNYKPVVIAPTCKEQGYTTYTCECGDTYVDDYVVATGHSYTSKITTPATHLSDGVRTFTCECGDTYVESVDKIVDHTYDAIITKPTCVKQGFTTYICECGDSYVDDYTEPTDHMISWDSIVSPNVTPPTCTERGYTSYPCMYCDNVDRSNYVDALGHSYTSEITIPATHTTDGVMIYTCYCGDTYTETIEKIAEHNHIAVITAPTCTEQGYTVYSCECGDSYVDDYVDALGHTEEIIPAVAPTCTETGLTEGVKCSVCGETFAEQKELPANGHTPANTVEENYVAPTCTENGNKDVVVYCSVCDEELNRETITLEATGHDAGVDGNCNTCDEHLCDHNCHKGGITGFFWKISNFFNKLFKTNKYCSCGIAHY